jgi:hypothetical protein
MGLVVIECFYGCLVVNADVEGRVSIGAVLQVVSQVELLLVHLQR